MGMLSFFQKMHFSVDTNVEKSIGNVHDRLPHLKLSAHLQEGPQVGDDVKFVEFMDVPERF